MPQTQAYGLWWGWYGARLREEEDSEQEILEKLFQTMTTWRNQHYFPAQVPAGC